MSEGGNPLGLDDPDEVKEQQQTSEQARQKQQEQADQTDDDDATDTIEADTSTSAETTDQGVDIDVAGTSDQESNTEKSSGQDEETANGHAEDQPLPNVKEREKQITVYLPKEVWSDLDRKKSELQLIWKGGDSDRELSDLRHIYPILVKLGMQKVSDLEPEEIAEYMDELEQLDREDSL